jgi:hypothetical protein
MKNHILQEVALLNILTEHSGSRAVNLEETPLIEAVNHRADGLQAHLWWRVRNQNDELRGVATLGFK